MRRRGDSVRHDVAIYSPGASAYYDRAVPQGGGAQLQMTLLARQLASRGWRVAHIVFPIVDPVEIDEAQLTVHTRAPYHGSKPGLNRIREAAAIWRALRAVDARTYVVRASAVNVTAVAEFCRIHRRGMVFSTANDFDLARQPIHGSRLKHAVYLHGLRAADVVVVQSSHQFDLARDLLRSGQRLELIPSFAEPVQAQAEDPDVFLWVSRITDYKRPLEFLRLARAVPEARFVMIMAEDVDNSDLLLEQIRREGQGISNFEAIGPLRRQGVLSYLERSVAIVSTSISEGMPNVFLEAWSRSVPALSLSFDPDGLIADREMGIAAGGSWNRFVEGATSLLVDADLRASLGDNARRYVEERHAPGVVCDRWESTLELISA